jgi:hypothetical protein
MLADSRADRKLMTLMALMALMRPTRTDSRSLVRRAVLGSPSAALSRGQPFSRFPGQPEAQTDSGV